MIQKHGIVLGLLVGLSLIVGSTHWYPGGSQQDVRSVGFSWQHNYVCDLLDTRAVNGALNPAKWIAITGLFVLCFSLACFFYSIAQKQPLAMYRNIMSIAGIAAPFFAFWLFTPYHNAMLALGSSCALVALVCLLGSLIASQYYGYAGAGIVCLGLVCLANYMYYSRHGVELLPTTQKLSLVCTLLWLLVLYYVLPERQP